MELKGNLEYWKISLKNPEPIVDEYYISDEIIVDDKKLIKSIERLRDLITTYCVLLEKDENSAKKILDEIYEIISDTDKIQYLIIEAKHIKESGGAQDKQIDEIIKFIKHSENSKFIHYTSFLDGIYFNNFILPPKSSKVYRQKQEIKEHLKNNPNNFFLNTAGIICLFQDLKKVLE
jgi:hypothetical protein